MPFIVPIIGMVASGIGSVATAVGGAVSGAAGALTAGGSGAMGLASLGLSAASGLMQYQNSRASAEIASKTAEYNAKLQENATIQADMENREEARREKARGAKLLAAQRALIGGSGVTTAGSPLEVLGETAGLIELGALDASRAADASYRRGFAGARMSRWEGANTASGFRRQGTASLLSTGTGLISDYYSMKNSGVFAGGGGG